MPIRTLRLVGPLKLAVALTFVMVCSNRSWAQPARRPEQPEWLDPNREAPLGSKYHVFRSSVLNADASCLVWLPPAYERAPNFRLPVIYWLHGAGGNQRNCSETFLPRYTKALRERTAPPAIIVAVNGIPMSLYGDSVDGKCPVESVIIKDLIPSIDKTFRTNATREGRLIEGYSMGGLGAARLGLKYPEIFGAVVINAPGPIGDGVSPPPLFRTVFGTDNDKVKSEVPAELAAKNADVLRKGTLIRLACGADDSLLPGARGLHEALTKLDIQHTYFELPGVAHEADKFYDTLGPRAFLLHSRAFGDRTAPPSATKKKRPAK